MNEISQFQGGHAIIEMMGHQHTSGFVTVENFGGPILFHVTAPEVLGPVETVATSTYVNGEHLLPGSKIQRKRAAVDKRVGAAAIYCITACSAQEAQERQPVITEIIERAAAAQLEAPDAAEKPTQINVELLYTNLTGNIDLSDYDEGVKDALGWVLRREPRPQLDVDEDPPDAMADEAEGEMDDLIAAADTEEEYTGF